MAVRALTGSPIGYSDTINSTGNTLAQLDCGSNVGPGSKCFVATGLQFWTLELSNAAVDHVNVEAALNFPAARWILDTGGGGAVTSIVAGTGISISGATGNVTITNSAPFGPDTIIQLNNSAAAPVSAWEGISTLSTNTAGAEVSKYVQKLLSGGAQVTAMELRPATVLLPNGALNAAAYSFLNNVGSGMWWDNTNSRLCFSIGNTSGGLADMFLSSTGQLFLEFSAPRLFFHSDGANSIGRLGTGGMQIVSTGGIAFFSGATPATKQAITGSRGGNAALASLLTGLAAYNFITDSTTA